MTIGVAIGMLIVGIIIGYYVGVRGRNLVAALKALTKKMSKDMASDGDEAEGLDEDEEEKPEDILEEFMYREAMPGMDDHPELTLNPVLMYHIKEAKAKKRQEMYRAQLKLEGLSDEEIEERMNLGGDGSGLSGIPQGKPNAFQILIMAGARVTAVAQGSQGDQAIIQERRRQTRTIDVFLAKERSIDTSKALKNKKPPRLLQPGLNMKQLNALQKAQETAVHPIGEDYAKRMTEMVGVAKRGRNMMRDQKARGKLTYVYVKEKKEKKRRDAANKEGGGGLNLDDLAALQAEFAGLGNVEIEGEEGEEGDDGTMAKLEELRMRDGDSADYDDSDLESDSLLA